MKKSILILSLMLAFASCKKDEPVKQACEINNTGSIKSINNKNTPYKIYLDNVIQQSCPANASVTISQIPAGVYQWKAVQESGFILYPTEYVATVTVVSCSESKVTFP